MLEEIMFPQSFAMIGGDDHPRPIEHAATLQIVKQLTQPLVHIRKTIVVAIPSQSHVCHGNVVLSILLQLS